MAKAFKNLLEGDIIYASLPSGEDKEFTVLYNENVKGNVKIGLRFPDDIINDPCYIRLTPSEAIKPNWGVFYTDKSIKEFAIGQFMSKKNSVYRRKIGGG